MFARKSVLVQLAIFGMPLLIAIWWALLADLRVNERRVADDAKRELEQVARIGARALEATVITADQMLVGLREHWRLNRGEFERIVQSRRQGSVLGADFNVTVTDRTGRVVWASASRTARGLDLSDTEVFRALRADRSDQIFFGAPMRPRLNRDVPWLLSFTRPLPAEDGGFGGGIAITVRPDYLARVFMAGGMPEGTSIALFRGDSTLLMRAAAGQASSSGEAVMTVDYPVPGSPESPFRAERFFAVAPSASYVRYRSEFDGAERMFASHPVGKYPLRITVGRTVGAIRAEYEALQGRYLLAGALATVLLLIGLSWWLLGRQARALADVQRLNDLSHLRRSEERLTATQLSLRELSSRQLALREAERKRVAQEVHDELGQRLTAIRMEVAMLPRAVAADPATELPRWVDRLKDDIDGALAITRDIAIRLRPAALDLGLPVAVGGLVAEFGEILGIPCTLDNRLPPGLELDETRSVAAFRILQEALTNAARHADATRIGVLLEVRGNELLLSVRDNGRGFLPREGRPGSLGLSGMRERASSVGGFLEIRSTPGEGTVVRTSLPLAGPIRPASIIPGSHDPLATVHSE